MKRKMLLLMSFSFLAVTGCLSVDVIGLLSQIENAVCDEISSGFPGGGTIDYCEVVSLGF